MDQGKDVEKQVATNTSESNATESDANGFGTSSNAVKPARTGLIFDVAVVICAVLILIVLLENANIL